MAKYTLDPYVESELWEIWQFIALDNPGAATRVIDAAFHTFELLAANPGIGRLRRFRNSRLRNVRSHRITGFENYLIFYRGTDDGIHVIHVYHGARNIESLFDES